MRRWILSARVMAAAFGLVTALQAGAVTVSGTPSTVRVDVGSSVGVVVSIAGLVPGAASLGAFSLDLSYDETLLAYEGVTFGPGLDLGIFGSGRFDDGSIPGFVAVDEISFEDPADLERLQPGSFVLVTLGFTALAQGTSPIGLAAPGGFADAQGGLLTVGLEGSSVTVVPEPSTLVLVGLALAGVSAARRPRGR